jgi:DNA adenine methylase
LSKYKYTPILKWAGGKSKITEIIVDWLPPNYNNYYEPFFGGGAIGLRLYQPDKNFYLSDVNKDLINFYLEIKNNCQQVIEDLKAIAEKFNNSDDKLYLYKHYKDSFNETRKPYLFYFLNKTSFNGLTRYNSKNEYNVPYGKRNFSYNADELLNLSEFLNKENVFIQECDFRNIKPQEKDLIYCDPPYHPLSETSNFTSYCGKWSEKDETDLASICKIWNEQGSYFMLSNNDVPFIRELFKDFFLLNCP